MPVELHDRSYWTFANLKRQFALQFPYDNIEYMRGKDSICFFYMLSTSIAKARRRLPQRQGGPSASAKLDGLFDGLFRVRNHSTTM